MRRSASQEGWAPDYALLKAKFFVDTCAFNQAIELLMGVGQSGVLREDEQRASMYFFLLALGYRGISDMENEKRTLSKVTSMPSNACSFGIAEQPVEQEEARI